MTDHNPAYTDDQGRTTADRIAAVQRGGDPITDRQHRDARLLLESLLLAAGLHGVTLADLDYVADLPGVCLDVIRRQGVVQRATQQPRTDANVLAASMEVLTATCTPNNHPARQRPR